MAKSSNTNKKRCRSKSCVRSRKRRQLRQVHMGISSKFTSNLPPSQQPQPQQQPSLFERYYLQAQNKDWLSGGEEEEERAFLSTLRAPLPVCFRIRHSSQQGKAVQEDLQRLLRQEGLQRYAIQRRLGGPRHRVWQLPAAVVQQVPRLKSWLARHSSSNSSNSAHLISRQELVSMIPVLLLGIQSHHQVLDLCASPGSKTLQALDALYDDHVENTTTTTTTTTTMTRQDEKSQMPTGFVLANELDAKRAYVLAHRCFGDQHDDTNDKPTEHSRRLTSLAVVCHNACKFPNVWAPLDSRSTTNITSSCSDKRPFDRIICDVPCSGDGTLRKDTKAWKVWHPTYGLQLHALQVRIAKRGIALLNIGGLMTYSTCSFHPIENEAVVAALLQTKCVELVQPTSFLKDIRYRPGWTTWKVLDDDCQELKCPDDHPEWPKTCWPPPPPPDDDDDDDDDDDGIAKSLRHCIRMVPHDNDTGGFFIALLRKVKDLPVRSSSSPLSSKPQGSNKQTKKPPMVTPQADHHQLYPVSSNVEDQNNDLKVFTRGKTGKHYYGLSPSLAHCLTEAPGSAKLNLVSAGLKHSLSPSPSSPL